ncbi:MAG: SPFH domain-containing protein [Bacteroidales bacterium]
MVNESQEAIFYKGKALDSFGPERTHYFDRKYSIASKLINLPFGGKTPFAAEVWYINKTIKRDLKWGTKTPMKLRDLFYMASSSL